MDLLLRMNRVDKLSNKTYSAICTYRQTQGVCIEMEYHSYYQNMKFNKYILMISSYLKKSWNRKNTH